MPKSKGLSGRETRAIWQLVGECRELGGDRLAWRRHWISGLADLVDAEIGISGEMGGCRSLVNRDLGVTFWWRTGYPAPQSLLEYMADFRGSPAYSPAMTEYHRRNREFGGICLARAHFLEDRTWYHSHDYQNIQEPFGADSTLWCFRPIPSAAPADENSGVILCRAKGRPGFDERDCMRVREAHALLVQGIGGALARYADPTVDGLTPAARRVLACLLEGDGDKQVAHRLGISPHTVNDHAKAIYRHYSVRGRSELLAHWIRRGWRPLTLLGPVAIATEPAGTTVEILP